MAELPAVFVAVDTTDLEAAKRLVGSLQMPGLGVKLGLEFFCAHGITGVKSVMEQAGNAALFLDLKFHDIPNTVAGAVRATTGLGPALLNVHASGGPAMMRPIPISPGSHCCGPLLCLRASITLVW